MAEEIIDLTEERLNTLQTLISAQGIVDDDKPTDDLKIVRSYKYDQPEVVAFSIDLEEGKVLTIFPTLEAKAVVQKTFSHLKGVLPENSLVMVEVKDKSIQPSQFTYREAARDEIDKAILKLS